MVEKLADTYLEVEPPGDLKTKKEIRRKNRNQKVSDSLMEAFMDKKKAVNAGVEDVEPDHGVKKNEPVFKQDKTKGASKSDQGSSAFRDFMDQLKDRKEADTFREEVNTIIEVEKEDKCKCVHGKCPPNKSTCGKCDAGWRGKLCDIPESKQFKA